MGNPVINNNQIEDIEQGDGAEMTVSGTQRRPRQCRSLASVAVIVV